MGESYYQRVEREAVGELQELLNRPDAPSSDYIGVIDEKTDKPEYFDPWDIFPVYGNYSSEFDDMALEVLGNLLNSTFKGETLAHEMFREMLCKKNLCDYGTSPRVCFPTTEFKELIPAYISKWRKYYKLNWRTHQASKDGMGGSDE
jgi:hypothetical protein